MCIYCVQSPDIASEDVGSKVANLQSQVNRFVEY